MSAEILHSFWHGHTRGTFAYGPANFGSGAPAQVMSEDNPRLSGNISNENISAFESVDITEIERFRAIAHEWWDEEGQFRPLHKMNPVRLKFIRDEIIDHMALPRSRSLVLDKVRVLDVGCGGGLASEPLARLGAKVTGVDAEAESIAIARTHASDQGLKIDYRHGTAESLDTSKDCFDVVLALEIIEHVANPKAFVQTISDLVRPGGLVIFSTLNRTIKSYLMGIVMAERVLKWLPTGTHNWSRFRRPAELAHDMRAAGLQVKNLSGITYSTLHDRFRLNQLDLDVNYMISAVKLG